MSYSKADFDVATDKVTAARQQIIELEKDIALEERLGLSTYVSKRVLKTARLTLDALLAHRDEIGTSLTSQRRQNSSLQ